MVNLEKKVDALVKKRFTDATTVLDTLPASHKLGGYVIWRGFTGESHRERQRKLWNLFRQNLAPGEQQYISAVITLTPAEYKSLMEDA